MVSGLKSRIEALEIKGQSARAHPEIITALRNIRAEKNIETETPDDMPMIDAMSELIDLLPG